MKLLKIAAIGVLGLALTTSARPQGNGNYPSGSKPEGVKESDQLKNASNQAKKDLADSKKAASDAKKAAYAQRVKDKNEAFAAKHAQNQADAAAKKQALHVKYLLNLLKKVYE